MLTQQVRCHIALPDHPTGTGFVFTCPGRYEEKAGYPCAGQTGRMLEAALPVLSDGLPGAFPTGRRKSYLITNAWPKVEYLAKTGRSVPTQEEITSDENIERLFQEVRSLRFVVACGDLAHVAVARCQTLFDLEAAVANAAHTSRRALGYPRREELQERLKQWAESVVYQFRA